MVHFGAYPRVARGHLDLELKVGATHVGFTRGVADFRFYALIFWNAR
jgi:hypothetical protein